MSMGPSGSSAATARATLHMLAGRFAARASVKTFGASPVEAV